MNGPTTWISIIGVVACLVLALRNPEIRRLGIGKTVTLVMIWAVIIIGLVLAIQLSGFRIAP